MHAFVNRLEDELAKYMGSKFAVAIGTGTAALDVALRLVGVEQNTEVITRALKFIATCNAICDCGSHHVFLDVDRATLGLSPGSLHAFLETH